MTARWSSLLLRGTPEAVLRSATRDLEVARAATHEAQREAYVHRALLAASVGLCEREAVVGWVEPQTVRQALRAAFAGAVAAVAPAVRLFPLSVLAVLDALRDGDEAELDLERSALALLREDADVAPAFDDETLAEVEAALVVHDAPRTPETRRAAFPGAPLSHRWWSGPAPHGGPGPCVLDPALPFVTLRARFDAEGYSCAVTSGASPEPAAACFERGWEQVTYRFDDVTQLRALTPAIASSDWCPRTVYAIGPFEVMDWLREPATTARALGAIEAAPSLRTAAVAHRRELLARDAQGT